MAISLISIGISLPVPGIGWVMAATTLASASLFTPLIGTRTLIILLGITLTHLFTFGPLAGFEVPDMPAFYPILFIALPIAMALVAIFFTIWRQRYNRRQGE